jgi:3'-phosphoadenosine 5'-phosphosulfate sulfotransferase (PAPS reductase)/FAD synthetase
VSRTGKSIFDIKRYKLLREFVIANPPAFKISERCCYYTKKQTATDFHREYKPDLVVTGMRRAEGGRRVGSLYSCFTPQSNQSPDSYRPLWFWTDEDKAIYKLWRDIRYSDCYEIYGMKRTGCVGCPCNSRAEQELEITQRFEPHTVKAAFTIFGASYIYRRQYAEFKRSFNR